MAYALESGGGSSRGRRTSRTLQGRPPVRYNIPKPSHRSRPAPAPYSPPPVSSNSSGQYSSYSSGGGRPNPPQPRNQGPIRSVGHQKPKPKPKPPPPPPSLKKYLHGDNEFQSQVSDYQRELERFLHQNKDQRGDVRETFRTAMGRMGQERQKSLAEMEADFASRGLLNSGLYNKSVGEYNTDYQDRVKDLTTDRGNSIQALLQTMGDYRSENRNQRQNARQEAIRRRAEQYGLKI